MDDLGRLEVTPVPLSDDATMRAEMLLALRRGRPVRQYPRRDIYTPDPEFRVSWRRIRYFLGLSPTRYVFKRRKRRA